jgi:pSer/pThr/pTyr-binding forkhead associated (FHA) protein
MMLTIHYRYKNGAEKIAEFSTSEIMIGRPNTVPIQLDLSPDRRVSRLHARLKYDYGTWWVEDLGSKHCTLLNEQPVTQLTELASDDWLQIGETALQVKFIRKKTDLLVKNGTITTLNSPETVSVHMSEDVRLQFLAQARKYATVTPTGSPVKTAEAADINAASGAGGESEEQLAGESQRNMLVALMRLIRTVFPSAESGTIAMREDKELVPMVFFPDRSCNLSYSLARYVIRTQQPLRWLRGDNPADPLPPSLSGVLSALYTPIIANRQVVGVLHVDSRQVDHYFEETHLQTLYDMALTMGRVLRPDQDNVPDIFPSIFISYSHQDRSLIDQLAADLRRRQVRVWFDERLQIGEDWRDQIKTAIEDCDAMVLVMSPRSLASQYVDEEIKMAQKAGKRLIPLLMEPCPIPDYLSSLQYGDLHGSNYQSSVGELIEALYRLI